MLNNEVIIWRVEIQKLTKNQVKNNKMFILGGDKMNLNSRWSNYPYIDKIINGDSSSAGETEIIDSNLEVKGNLDTDGNITSTGSIIATGNISAFSDERIKENVSNICDSLDKVRRMNGVYYNIINNTDVKHIGLIAQEVKEVLPEVVIENDYGILSIDYSRIVALLINAIKELEDKVNSNQN